ncbi:MAG: macro domain-containing protein [candidate division Zixibacteria bacterium]|nr:macro domain-containing protein [candidate division Zixibacteria bacterium]MDH3937290.1 macro domain-containing protein [candidate division Zixibacteria bacterium]
MPYRVEIVKGDITQVDVDAIVNAANNELWMGAGVAGAIKSTGGEIIEREAMAKGPIMPGEAVFTTAGKLPHKAVIHAAVMGQDLRTTDKLIRQATIATLNTAENLKLSSLALPAFGTGVGGFPMKACAYIMTRAVNGYQPLAKHLERVLFCLFDEYAFQTFKDALVDES